MRSGVRIERGSKVKVGVGVGVEVVIEVGIEVGVTRRTTATTTSEAPGALGSRGSLRSLRSPSAAVLVPEDSVFHRSPHSVRLTVAGVPRALRPPSIPTPATALRPQPLTQLPVGIRSSVRVCQ